MKPGRLLGIDNTILGARHNDNWDRQFLIAVSHRKGARNHGDAVLTLRADLPGSYRHFEVEPFAKRAVEAGSADEARRRCGSDTGDGAFGAVKVPPLGGTAYSRRGTLNALPPTAVYCPSFPCHAMSQKPSARTKPAAGEGRYLTFSLGDESDGLAGAERSGDHSPLSYHAGAPDAATCKGVINLRGTVIAVLDLRAKFQLTPKDYGERTCIIVVQVAAPSGDSTLMGAVVDAVEEVVQLGATDIEATPDFGGAPETQYFGLGHDPRRRQNPARTSRKFFRGQDPIAAAHCKAGSSLQPEKA